MVAQITLANPLAAIGYRFQPLTVPDIFRFNSCPVCASGHVYKSSEGFERCRHCDYYYSVADSVFIPPAVFPVDDGREILCLPGRVS